jgi:hypothetical protein
MDVPESWDKCRDCAYWYPIPPWQGNCKLYPTTRPQWSEDATPNMRGCHGFRRRVVPGTYRHGKLVKP